MKKIAISLALCVTFTVLGALIGYYGSRIETSHTNKFINEMEKSYQEKLKIAEEKQSECRDYLVMIREKGFDIYWKNLKVEELK